MAGCQDVLTETFLMLIAQKASAEVILEVLIDEAALLFPSLQRPDLEAIVIGVLEEAKEQKLFNRSKGNIVHFPKRELRGRATN